MPEYLISFGRSGDFGRFRCSLGDLCERGERVVVRTTQGLELGTVLCPVATLHEKFLSHTSNGEVVRLASCEDDAEAGRMRERADTIFLHGRQLADQLQLPLEIVDVDVLLDGQQAVIYHLRRESCDYRPMVSELSRIFEIRIVMENLAMPAEEHHGCGKPDCGGGGGSCSSCGSGGGCSTCGAGTHPEEIAAYLASLQDSQPSPRVPLL